MHLYKSHNFTDVLFPSSRLNVCDKWIGLMAVARGTLVEAQSGCVLCTKYAHKTERGFQKKYKKKPVLCKEMVTGW